VSTERESKPVRVACDAMCGGLARWLRVLGVDATYAPGIEDQELVRQALEEGRILVTSDHKILERRVFTSGQLASVALPVGLPLDDQVRYVVQRLRPEVGFPRCASCNGELAAVRRTEVADVVPARSLIWAREFYRCRACGHVFWEGSHWRRIGAVRAEMAEQASARLRDGATEGAAE
jgi:uncharacterized protein with PIN domain